jgi:hypothetical protein
MRKAFIAALFLVACAAVSFAQTPEFQKNEVYVGYSANEVDTQGAFSSNPNDTGRDHFNGFNVEATRNVSRYLGVQADYSFHQKSQDVPVGTATGNVRARLQQFMGGVKVQDNALDVRFRPFAHALVGVAHDSVDAIVPSIITTNTSDNGLALAIGGGLDIRATKHIDVRAIQLDYNPNRNNGDTDHNFRIGAGLNFRF